MVTKEDLKQFATKEELKQCATKEDLERFATKEDLKSSEERVINKIDGFITLHQTLDVELASLRSRCERMEGFMVQVGDKLDMKYQPT
jgi:hypothetical protein